jgi:hypothetical protein
MDKGKSGEVMDERMKGPEASNEASQGHTRAVRYADGWSGKKMR